MSRRPCGKVTLSHKRDKEAGQDGREYPIRMRAFVVWPGKKPGQMSISPSKDQREPGKEIVALKAKTRDGEILDLLADWWLNLEVEGPREESAADETGDYL